MVLINKEIQKIKIAITSICTLRCLHCRVDKTLNIKPTIKDCYKAIDLFLNSPGRFKRLEVYGGEPFIEFENLKKITSYAKRKAKKKKIKLTLQIATNATLINNKIIEWLKRNKEIIIAVSFNGTLKSQQAIRRFPDGKSSYKIVKENIKRIVKSIGQNRVVAIYCVDPIFAKDAFRDFKEIIKTGIRIVAIECAHGRGWNEERYLEFEKNIKDINHYILTQAKKDIFIFHEKFIELLRLKGKKVPECPFYFDLEMYPDGNLGFYPYPFVNYASLKDKIKIGSIKEGIYEKYKKCTYHPQKCNLCIRNYYTIAELYDGSIAYHKIRESEIDNLFYTIVRNSKKDKVLKFYLTKLTEVLKGFYK
ncbi:MAG: radical SAM protein, partial [bacterium]